MDKKNRKIYVCRHKHAFVVTKFCRTCNSRIVALGTSDVHLSTIEQSLTVTGSKLSDLPYRLFLNKLTQAATSRLVAIRARSQ